MRQSQENPIWTGLPTPRNSHEMDEDCAMEVKESAGGGSDGGDRGRCGLLELPGEVLSQIAACMSLSEAVTFLSLHPLLLGLTRSHLTPFPTLIHQALLDGPPYPVMLERLPALSLYHADDDGRMWIEALVRARPRWILERMVIGSRWRESVWKEAFQRRFLPSWKMYKKEGDTWRAVFLSRLEHRALGCTHEESWTRFLTLHRNGSGSLNRIYSRTFDPYEIFDELKNQNNLTAHPTTVRVLVHLQDVRIIVVGVLYSQPTLFVNPNAHLVLHPPLLRGVRSEPVQDAHDQLLSQPAGTSQHRQSVPTAVSNAGPTEAYYSLVRTMSPSSPASTSYGLTDGPMPKLRQKLAPKLLSRPRRTSAPEGADDSRPKKWIFGRSRANSSVVATDATGTSATGRRSSDDGARRTSTEPALPPLEETVFDDRAVPAAPPRRPTPPIGTMLPYRPLVHPTPSYSHRLYPNWTPAPDRSASTLPVEPGHEIVQDLRAQHADLEDDEAGTFWAGDAPWPDGSKRVEVGENLERLRWAGPMLVMAQLHPSDRTARHPAGATAGPVEGHHPDLGPRGMYVSLGFEDLEALCPWLELRGGGAHHAEAKRDGLGF